MKKLFTAGAAAVAVAATMIGGFAWAAGPPYTVSVGGSSTGPADPYTATSTGTVRMQFKNNSSAVLTMSCSSLSLAGSVTKGTAVNPWATVTSTTFSGCTLIPGAMTVAQIGTLNLSGTGSNATTGTETIQGNVGNAGWSVAGSPPSACSFTVRGPSASTGGTVSSWFNEPTQLLMFTETGFTGNLRIWNVVGCLGQLQNGNPANFEATLNVSATSGAVNLS